MSRMGCAEGTTDEWTTVDSVLMPPLAVASVLTSRKFDVGVSSDVRAPEEAGIVKTSGWPELDAPAKLDAGASTTLVTCGAIPVILRGCCCWVG